MPLPTTSDVHVDSALTNISIAYLQDASHFIATQVFPNVPVQKQSDYYFEFDRGDFNRNEAKKRAPNAESAGGGYNLDSSANYFCDVFSYHHDIPDQVRANADQAVPQDRAAAEFVMHKMLINREVDFASTFLTGGVWDNDVDGVAGTPATNQVVQWSDATSGDPIGDIRAAKTTVLQNTGFMPNTLVIGQEVMDALEDHPDIVDRVKYSGGIGNQNPAKVSPLTLAQLFEVERVVIGRAIQNTAKEGATAVHSFIAGKTALLVYSAPTPDIMVPSGGYTFSWSNYLNVGNPFGVATRQFRIEHRRTTRFEGEAAYDQKLISAAMGYFWDSIVA